MPTILKVANVHFTQTGNNRLEYTGNGVIRLTATGTRIPVGTSGDRPQGEKGIIRYNTTLESFEGHNGTAWANIVSGIVDLTPPFAQANTARDQANTARLHSNAAFNNANLGFSQANTARLHANVAFDQANTARLHSNAAFNNANLGFSQANTARLHANVAFERANLGFVQANVASPSQFRIGTSNTALLSPNNVWSSAGLSVLTDAATITVDFSTGFNFGGSNDGLLLLGGNRTLGAPTNLKTGQSGILWFGATGATRTLTLNASWVVITGVETGPYSITTSQTLGIAYVIRESTVYVTSVLRVG